MTENSSKKKLQGKLTISRPSYSSGKKAIIITLNDELSGTEVLVIEVGYAEFTEALTGCAYTPCQFELRSGVVGKQREVKTEQIRLPEGLGYKATDEQLRAILAPYEVDGWKGWTDDLTNHHRAAKGDHKLRTVTFIRFVEAAE